MKTHLSHSHRLCSHTWKPPHSRCHLLHSDLPRILGYECPSTPIKRSDCTCQAWFSSCGCFSSRLSQISITIFTLVASGQFIERHGSFQVTLPAHTMDGAYPDHWWWKPSDYRSTMALARGGQASTESDDIGAHRLCPSHQCTEDHHWSRYHHILSFIPRVRVNETVWWILTS